MDANPLQVADAQSEQALSLLVAIGIAGRRGALEHGEVLPLGVAGVKADEPEDDLHVRVGEAEAEEQEAAGEELRLQEGPKARVGPVVLLVVVTGQDQFAGGIERTVHLVDPSLPSLRG